MMTYKLLGNYLVVVMGHPEWWFNFWLKMPKAASCLVGGFSKWRLDLGCIYFNARLDWTLKEYLGLFHISVPTSRNRRRVIFRINWA